MEGETELGALLVWSSKSPTARRQQAPEDLHIAFYSVDGDQSFQHLVGYLHAFEIPWATVCDGAAFRFDVARHIFTEVTSVADETSLSETSQRMALTSKTPEDVDEALFGALVKAGRMGGIFTLARGWQRKDDAERDRESFEAFLESKPELARAPATARAQTRNSKPRLGRIVADTTDCPDEVDRLYVSILERLRDKGMS